jgi:hypothetical protein
MFLTRKQWALLHCITAQGMHSLPISNLRFKTGQQIIEIGCELQTSG